MQEKLTIARPYAAAAFAYAVEHGEIPAWSANLQTLAIAVSDPALPDSSDIPRSAANSY